MKIKNIDLDKEVYVIAEIGNNHEGSYALAEELVGLAAEAGVHAAKLQMIHPEQFVCSTDTARFDQLKKFQLTHQEYERLFHHATKAGIHFMTTPFDLEAVDVLDPWVPAFKVASSDNDFFPLLEKIAQTKKPICLSTGLAEVNEIKAAVNFIENEWTKNQTVHQLAILHCVTNYPTPKNEAHISTVSYLKELFPNHTVGYSDHTLGIDACTLAVANGARIIEKHFTIDHNHSSFRDHQLSANPQELKLMIEKIKEAQVYLGPKGKFVTEAEETVKARVRRSIAFKTNLPKGHKITFNDLIWVRPGSGMAPGNESKILGKVLTSNVSRGDIITLDHIGN